MQRERIPQKILAFQQWSFVLTQLTETRRDSQCLIFTAESLKIKARLTERPTTQDHDRAVRNNNGAAASAETIRGTI